MAISEPKTSPVPNGDDGVPATAGETTVDNENRERHRQRWLESISVALLSIATLAAAWCGYQAALWGGQQASHYTQAGARRVESVRANTVANQYTQVDIAVFMNWLNASMEESEELADFYQSRMSDVLAPAFDAWLEMDPFTNPDAPNAPFGMPEYIQPDLLESQRLEDEAAEHFDLGQAANKESDAYVRTTVFLATTLFFLALSTRIEWLTARMVLTVIASGMLLVGLGYAATLGIAS